MLYKGGCHCGAVTFEVDAPEQVEVEDCNCSICAMTGYLHLIVPENRFRQLTGRDQLSTYTFGKGVAKHTFCKVCGVKPFYIPRSNPDGVDVNVRCLDTLPVNMQIMKFDGKNWELHAHKLKDKSRV